MCYSCRISKPVGVFLACSLLLLLSCSTQTSDTTHSFRSYRDKGTSVVVTKGGPKYSEELFVYEQVLRLNQDESREESLLGRPLSGGLMDEAGSVYIRERQPNRIACFDSEGNYSHDIGRAGQGPGEYQQVPELLYIRNGILSVFDSRLSRTSFFRTDGTFLESITAMRQRRRFGLREYHRSPRGNLISFEDIHRGGFNDFDYDTKVVTVMSADDDTLALLSTETMKTSYTMDGGRIAWRMFGGYPQAVYHPDHGIYMSTGEEPEIQVYNQDGVLRRIIKLEIPPEPVTSEEKRALRQSFEKIEDDRIRTDYLERFSYIEFCDPKASWSEIILEENGYIWAELPGSAYYSFTHQWEVSYRYRIFSPEGEYLGNTTWPHWGSVSRGHLITFQTNEETGGSDYIIYRIRPAVERLKYPEY